MKRIISLILSAVLALSLSACGNGIMKMPIFPNSRLLRKTRPQKIIPKVKAMKIQQVKKAIPISLLHILPPQKTAVLTL